MNNLDIQKEEFRNVWSAMAPRLTDRLVREVVLHHLEPQAAVGVEGQVLHLERQAVDVGGIVWMAVSITDGYQTVPVTDYMRSFLAAGICGVWLKLVSWLSVINWQVINLVGLLSQIVRGIRWILLFLVMTIFASSQMFYVMLSGLSCDENGYYCEKDNAYLKFWAILLGQRLPNHILCHLLCWV